MANDDSVSDDEKNDEVLGNKEKAERWAERIREEREPPIDYYVDKIREQDRQDNIDRYGVDKELPPPDEQGNFPEPERTPSGAKITTTKEGWTYTGTPQHPYETLPEEEPEFERKEREDRKQIAEDRRKLEKDAGENLPYGGLTQEQIDEIINQPPYSPPYSHEPEDYKYKRPSKIKTAAAGLTSWGGNIISKAKTEREEKKTQKAEVKRLAKEIALGKEVKIRPEAEQAMIPLLMGVKSKKEFRTKITEQANKPSQSFWRNAPKEAGKVVLQSITGLKLPPRKTFTQKIKSKQKGSRIRRYAQATKEGKGLIPSLLHGTATGRKSKGGGGGFFGGVPSRMRFKFSERRLYPTPRKVGYKAPPRPTALWQANIIKPNQTTSTLFKSQTNNNNLLGFGSNVLHQPIRQQKYRTLTLRKHKGKKK